MVYIDELDFGDEIRGAVCPKCGGELIYNKEKPWCYDDGFVKPKRQAGGPTSNDTDFIDINEVYYMEPEVD